MSITVNNSSIQDYGHLEKDIPSTYDGTQVGSNYYFIHLLTFFMSKVCHFYTESARNFHRGFSEVF